MLALGTYEANGEIQRLLSSDITSPAFTSRLASTTVSATRSSFIITCVSTNAASTPELHRKPLLPCVGGEMDWGAT